MNMITRIFYWNAYLYSRYYPINIYLFKVNNRNTKKRWEVCSKLPINTPERRRSFWRKQLTATSQVFFSIFSAFTFRMCCQVLWKSGIYLSTDDWLNAINYFSKKLRRRSCAFVVNFEHISHHFLVFLLLTLNK